VQVFAKAEWFNPGGSIKDRPAFNILRTALASCELIPGKRLLDSTSGNMGIAYATFGAAMDVPVTLVVPANASPERSPSCAPKAELILTDRGSDGAILVARRIASENSAALCHSTTTRQLAGACT
jgi:cysteine synthase B